MKTRLFSASAVLASLVTIAASGLPGTAQEPAGRRLPVEQQERSALAPSNLVADPGVQLPPTVPRECEHIRPEVQTHDVPDKFKPPGVPVTLSTAFTNWINANNVKRKGYDDNRDDMAFADSFRIRTCRVCYATLEFSAQHAPGQWSAGAPDFSNDGILAGAAPFTLGLRFFGSTTIWNATSPNPNTVTYGITPAGLTNLNNYLMTTTTPSQTFVDVYAQDDTDIDYVKLSVWYY